MPDYELLKGAETGNVTRISLALEKGGALHAKNNYGVSPLIIAANNGHHESVKRLLDAGAHIEDYSNNGRTPLIWAAWWGHLQVVEVLLEYGAHINEKDNHGMTPLMSATVNGHVGVVELLLKNRKIEVGLKNEWNSTALSIAKRKQYHHIIDLLEPLHPVERHISPYELLFHHSYAGITNMIKDILSLVAPKSFIDTLTSDKSKDVEDSL
jgi:serine/threonine-protein phosphatase 6 regulatory ankyrin repeat subunit B